jgi:hypothetical protein
MKQPHFEGNVDTRWLVERAEDRTMEVLSEFAFVDSSRYRWEAHPGDKVDGTSIPEAVWSSVVGTPFVGDVRRASVVHDLACDRREQTSKRAHRMFYEAMLADGTSKERAILFYIAVRLFGPRWDREHRFPAAPIDERMIDFDELEAALDKIAHDEEM